MMPPHKVPSLEVPSLELPPLEVPPLEVLLLGVPLLGVPLLGVPLLESDERKDTASFCLGTEISTGVVFLSAFRAVFFATIQS